jgi:uncharacterized protein YuzE
MNKAVLEIQAKMKTWTDAGIELAYNSGYERGKEDTEKKHNSDLDYKDGLEDGRMEAWECAKKIYKMTAEEVITVFGGCSNWVDYSVDEAIAKIKEYEDKQKQDAIQIGDEVVGDFGATGVVVGIETYRGEALLSLLMGSHKTPQIVKASRYKTKTGRHFPQIVEVLEQMKGEADGKDLP